MHDPKPLLFLFGLLVVIYLVLTFVLRMAVRLIKNDGIDQGRKGPSLILGCFFLTCGIGITFAGSTLFWQEWKYAHPDQFGLRVVDAAVIGLSECQSSRQRIGLSMLRDSHQTLTVTTADSAQPSQISISCGAQKLAGDSIKVITTPNPPFKLLRMLGGAGGGSWNFFYVRTNFQPRHLHNFFESAPIFIGIASETPAFKLMG
jgi:hypothetical protein